MRIPVEFDLQNRAVIVHWPWGQHSFPQTEAGLADMMNAFENFSIESGRLAIAMPPPGTSIIMALRKAVESSGVVVRRFTETGKLSVPSLSDLGLDDLDPDDIDFAELLK